MRTRRDCIGMRTGIERMPWMKFEYVRRGAANTSMTG
jgi:hypothetical protein